MTFWLCLGGAAAGVLVGFLQYRLLDMIRKSPGDRRTMLILPLKFLLWAGVLLGALAVNAETALVVMGAAAVFYTGTAVHIYIQAHREG